MDQIKELINSYYEKRDTLSDKDKNSVREILERFLDLLETGEIRSANKIDGKWITNEWVKKGILLLFKTTHLAKMQPAGPMEFSDKDLLTLRKASFFEHNIRMVPGGSSLRRGCYLGKNCVVMPPSYMNIGSYVDDGSMIDSHALIGSCAQVGKNVHVSAGVQVGGVLEPIGLNPVIIEDDAMLGGQSGIYESVLVSSGAIIGTGVILNRSTHIFDLVNGTIIKADEKGTLVVPENAVLVQGGRKVKGDFAEEHGVTIYTPLIIKYRDDRTASKIKLEKSLR